MPASPAVLEALEVENYKAFPGSASVEFAPLTVLIGRNGSGKSALSRLPLAVAEALRGRGEPGLPLKVDGFALGESLRSFTHGGAADRFVLRVGLRLADASTWRIECLIGKDPASRVETPAQWVESWKVSGSRVTGEWGVEWDRTQRQYVSQGAVVAGLRFAGIWPQMPAPFPFDAAGLMGCLNVHHLGAMRVLGNQRFESAGPKPLWACGPDGARTRAVLGSRTGEARAALIGIVQAELRRILDVELDVREVGEGPVRGSIVLARPAGRDTWVDAAELGTGLQHLLPVVVQHSLLSPPVTSAGEGAGDGGNGWSLLVTEEPEAHLHPRAQAEMADSILGAVLRGERCLVETHSETFILRLRRRVAEGTIPPTNIALYWIDDEGANTDLKRAVLTPRGDIDGFPTGWFDAALSEVRAIGRAGRE